MKIILISFMLSIVACSSSSSENGSTVDVVSLNMSDFLSTALVGETTIVPCTLSNGTVTTCHKFVIAGVPGADHDMGPFCPETITSTEGGIWLEAGVKHEVDGPFIANMAEFYNDSNWSLYNTDGTVKITDTKESCEAAAKPDVEVEYQNYCVECDVSYMTETTNKTVYLPVTPVVSGNGGTVGANSGVGIALNGVTFDPPAPTDAILGAYTLAPFDDCGGHVNLVAGYHYHAATGCSHAVEKEAEHAKMIGYAMDGIGLFQMLNTDGNEPTDLDECRGHVTEELGYHYHVAGAGENMFIACFKGETGCIVDGVSSDSCDASASSGVGGGPPGGGPPGGGPPPE